MYFYLYVFASLIAFAFSENSTLLLINHTKEIRSNSTKLEVNNKTILPVVNEGGGTLVPNTPDLSLPKDKLNSLITLDEELSKPKEKAVVPRKGVDMQADNKNPIPTVNKEKINLLPEIITSSTKSVPAVTNKYTDVHLNSAVPNIKPVGIKSENTESPVVKKPLILSYEALANMKNQIQSDPSKLTMAPSTQTMASSQIPSPNKDKIKKVYPSIATNSHPGMIMPIVITILVVPMFVIVGYFALKRGQEAWKNRHYKRMDFLLDGMYND